MVAGPDPERVAQVAERVREIAADYPPPDFAEVPGPDAALFLSAIDHGTGYEGAHEVGGERHEGSALLWALGIEAEHETPGTLSAEGLAEVGEAEVGQMFGVGGEVVAGPGERARLWRGLSAGLADELGGLRRQRADAPRLAGRPRRRRPGGGGARRDP